MQIEKVPVGSLVLDPTNARKHDQKNLEAIKGSLAKFGQQKPIVVTADNVVIAGNGTLEAAKALGWENIDIHRTVLKGAEAMAYALADNRTAELADWDDEILKEQIGALAMDGWDVGDFGFDLDDFDLDAGGTEGKTDPDDVPEVEENKFGVSRGQIWQIGEHRLMCGDSTSKEDVDRLMGGNLADVWITDPPYNVDYVGKTKDSLKIENDMMSNENFRSFLIEAFSSAVQSIKPGGVFYIWHADSEGLNFREACFKVGLKVRQCLIWCKDVMVMGRQDYHWKHEPCLYGWKDGAGHLWAADRKQTTILNFARPKRNDIHPTMKPVDLIEYQIKNNTKGKDLVLDTFLGSGSTLIACEKTGRKCYGMEIDPHYCSVIIERWQNFTGKEATRLG
jgi:site-specific DNA-methyltransferase (adenine-specific)